MQKVANVKEASVVISITSLQDAIVLAFDRGMAHGVDIERDRVPEASDNEYLIKTVDDIMKIVIDGSQ